MKRQRLSRQSWVDAGLKALVSKGPSALAAEPLARDLKTTKGSFYWHFKDVPEFQATVVKHWQSEALTSVVAALADSGTAEQRLRRFGQDILTDKTDPAMRAWARSDKSVANAVAQIDAERLTYVTNLLKHLGLKNDDFGRSCLGALIGLPSLSGKNAATKSFDTMIDMVLALA
ncbi:MAG: TetR/AcrR family transcriptional regulator [Pseudomonadota bacterium]